MGAFADHIGCETTWLDDRSQIRPCPRCGTDAYMRRRALSGAGHPLHVHEIVACVQCGIWQCLCIPDAIPQHGMEAVRG